MKKSLQILSIFLAVTFFGTFKANAQVPCSVGLHKVFGDDPGTKPVLLNRLGTSPQFGEIPKHTAQSAYTHLSNVYKRNLRNSRGEIDTFLKALGYTGFKDPAFGVSVITAEILPQGKIGWMGAYSKGHNYKWSILGRDFETFKIQAKDASCFAYIMKKCGNAFYVPIKVVPCNDICDPKCPNYDPTKCPPFCLTQTLNFSGNGKIQASDVINTTKSLPIVASYNGKNVCLGDYTVPVRLTYEVTASGQVNYAKTIEVCDYGNTPASLNLNLTLNIKYELVASEVSIGENGIMNMSVNKKQFKALKKVYSTCPANQLPTSTANSLSGTKVANVSEASASSMSAGKGNPRNCVKQTLNMTGSATTEDISDKSTTQEILLIGVYKKTSKLKIGETAEKYRCLGSYNLPAKSQLQYKLNASSNLEQIIEICDNGSVNPIENISLPMTMQNNFTKQEVMVGDYGRVYTSITKKQYNKLRKTFRRCCADGGTKCF